VDDSLSENDSFDAIQEYVARTNDVGTFASKRNIVFRENKTVQDFLGNPHLGNLDMFGMNIIKTLSETSLKCPVLVQTTTHCNTATIYCASNRGIDELEDVNLHQLAPRPVTRNLSISSNIDNGFYLGEDERNVSETTLKQLNDSINSSKTTNAADCVKDTSTNKHSMKLTRHDMTPFKYLGSFESYRHAKACTIPALTVLQNGSILLIDHYHSKIQLFDKEFKFVAETDVNYPVGLCAIDAHTVAVSQRRESKIAFVRIDAQGLTKVKEISPCNFYLWQIACKANKLFVICDENNVHVMNTDGSAIATIRTGVRTEMGFIRNFDVSDDAQRLFLCERSALRCISSSGETIWRITPDHLPVRDRCSQQLLFEDVCIFENYLFGTMWIAGKIALINMEGEIERYVVTNNLDHPRAMAVGTGKLFVAQFSSNHTPLQTRAIKMFSLKTLNPKQ